MCDPGLWWRCLPAWRPPAACTGAASTAAASCAHLLWGADIDPVGPGRGRGRRSRCGPERRPRPGGWWSADPLVGGAGAWPAPPAGRVRRRGRQPAVPEPARAGHRPQRRRPPARLRARYGAAVRAYTDTAWLFLLLGCDLVRPGGRVVAGPAPVGGGRPRRGGGAGRGRRTAPTCGTCGSTSGRVFAAAVRVCAPVLGRRAAPPTGRRRGPTPAGGRGGGPGRRPRRCRRSTSPGHRGRRHARRTGRRRRRLPRPVLRARRRGARARRPGRAARRVAPLVTSGALDWAACSWGDRPVRFAKRRWRRPGRRPRPR